MEEFELRLQESSICKSLELKLLNAKQNKDMLSDFWSPYLRINMQPNGFFYTETLSGSDEEKTSSTSLDISTQLDLVHFLGADIGLSLPLKYKSGDESESEIIMNRLGLSISRRLIAEEYANQLGAGARYIESVYALEQQQWQLFIQLVKDVFDQKYYQNLNRISTERLSLYQRKFNAEKDEDMRQKYKKQILLLEKSLLNTRKFMATITPFSDERLKTLYEEIEKTIPELYKTYLETFVSSETKDISALRLELEKAYEEKNLWFLPYIMNPIINFNLEYYFDDADSMGASYKAGDWKWSIGISGSLDLLDRGERELKSIGRKNTYEIKKLELEEELENSSKRLNQMIADVEIASLELELKLIDLEQAIDDSKTAIEKYSKGYVTYEDKQLSVLERYQAELDYLGALEQLYLSRLNLMRESGNTIGGYFDEEAY